MSLQAIFLVVGSGVSAGDVLESLGDEEDMDDVWGGLASSSVWAALTIVSSGDAEWRLEFIAGADVL
jgi:hypothetical protein